MTLNRREFLFAIAAAASTKQDLISRWKTIARKTDGTVGVAALDPAMNGDERFPLASVCKVPIAMNILALVDEGKLSLDHDIEVLPRDVWSGVSQIAPRWPLFSELQRCPWLKFISHNRTKGGHKGTQPSLPRSRLLGR